MNNQQAYNRWANNYDSVQNKTRDLEAIALRKTLAGLSGLDILEIGCGTGKNTEWLATKARRLMGADFSAEMLARAQEKITATHAEFRQLDLRHAWGVAPRRFDLITCSLVLEHIENIDFVFHEAAAALRPGGLFYIGELHPFKQYQGSKARFETAGGEFVLECFVHNVSEFFQCAGKHGFECIDLQEWFDADGTGEIPRILSLLLRVKRLD